MKLFVIVARDKKKIGHCNIENNSNMSKKIRWVDGKLKTMLDCPVWFVSYVARIHKNQRCLEINDQKDSFFLSYLLRFFSSFILFCLHFEIAKSKMSDENSEKRERIKSSAKKLKQSTESNKKNNSIFLWTGVDFVQCEFQNELQYDINSKFIRCVRFYPQLVMFIWNLNFSA